MDDPSLQAQVLTISNWTVCRLSHLKMSGYSRADILRFCCVLCLCLCFETRPPVLGWPWTHYLGYSLINLKLLYCSCSRYEVAIQFSCLFVFLNKICFLSPLIFYFFILKFFLSSICLFIVCLSVLCACITCISHPCLDPREVKRCPGTRVPDDCEWPWELNSVSIARTNALNYWVISKALILL